MLPFHLFSFQARLNKLLYVFFVCIFRCYNPSRINSSGMQCRWLSVWSVDFIFNTLSCQIYFFPEGMGVYIALVEIPEGWGGGVIFVFKNWKSRGGGGALREIPSVVGVWIFSGTTHSAEHREL